MYAINELRFLLSEANYLTGRAITRQRVRVARFEFSADCGKHDIADEAIHNVLSILRPRKGILVEPRRAAAAPPSSPLAGG
jgi:hypothetical protein